MYVDSYNKAADYMNRGGTEKFNASQRKKYGKDYAKRDGYETDYYTVVDKKFSKFMNQSLRDFYQKNEHYQKAKSLVDQWGMTKWDDLARENEEKIEEIRRALENN